MSFSIASLIPACQSRTSSNITESTKLLQKPEIIALTTDVALATLALFVATLVLLQTQGFIQLGALSSIGNIGTIGVFSLFSLAGGILLLNTIAFLAKQSFLIVSFRRRQQELEREHQAFVEQNTLRESEFHLIEGQLRQAQEAQTDLQTQLLLSQEQPTEGTALLLAEIHQLQSEKNQMGNNMIHYINRDQALNEELTRLQSCIRELESQRSATETHNHELVIRQNALENEHRELYDRIVQLETELLADQPVVGELPNPETSEENAAPVENESQESQPTLYSNTQSSEESELSASNSNAVGSPIRRLRDTTQRDRELLISAWALSALASQVEDRMRKLNPYNLPIADRVFRGFIPIPGTDSMNSVLPGQPRIEEIPDAETNSESDEENSPPLNNNPDE